MTTPTPAPGESTLRPNLRAAPILLALAMFVVVLAVLVNAAYLMHWFVGALAAYLVIYFGVNLARWYRGTATVLNAYGALMQLGFIGIAIAFFTGMDAINRAAYPALHACRDAGEAICVVADPVMAYLPRSLGFTAATLAATFGLWVAWRQLALRRMPQGHVTLEVAS